MRRPVTRAGRAVPPDEAVAADVGLVGGQAGRVAGRVQLAGQVGVGGALIGTACCPAQTGQARPAVREATVARQM